MTLTPAISRNSRPVSPVRSRRRSRGIAFGFRICCGISQRIDRDCRIATDCEASPVYRRYAVQCDPREGDHRRFFVYRIRWTCAHTNADGRQSDGDAGGVVLIAQHSSPHTVKSLPLLTRQSKTRALVTSDCGDILWKHDQRKPHRPRDTESPIDQQPSQSPAHAAAPPIRIDQ